jgi:hypothetical protein
MGKGPDIKTTRASHTTYHPCHLHLHSTSTSISISISISLGMTSRGRQLTKRQPLPNHYKPP